MPAETPEIQNQIRVIINNLSLGKKISLLALAGVMILMGIYLVVWAGKPDLQLLLSELSLEDSGAIIEKLKAEKIQYKITSNGTSIMVPKEKLYEIRLKLASQGLPNGSSVGFEIFDETKLGMTEFVQNINFQRAMQGELTRTINSFEEIDNSRVHIVMPKKTLFLEEEEPASASVVLKLRPGRRLKEQQIQGIVHLVASSISGLAPDNITIVDTRGIILSEKKDKTTTGRLSSNELDYREKIERGLENRIKSMLDSALGAGKSTVRVSGTFDFNRREMTEEKYNKANQVVRSEQLVSENSSSQSGRSVPMGVPGVLSNTTKGGKGINAGQGGSGFQKQDRTVNYEIGKITKHVIEPVGEIDRLSVAVLIDGTYKRTTNKEAKQELKYFPRPKAEMEKLENIVKRAMNFNPERGDQIEVVNIPFATIINDDLDEVQEKSLLSRIKENSLILKYAFVAFFMFMTFLFIVRPLVRWLTSMPAEDMSMVKELPMTVGELENEYGKAVKSIPYQNNVDKLISTDKSESVNIMKEWMDEE